jgi:predicted DNA-binding transcriptional regulator AlpA
MKTKRLPDSLPAKLMNVKELAVELKVSERHVHRMKDAGLIPPPLRLGGAVRWDRDVIYRWIEAGCPRLKEWKGGAR